VTTGAIHLIYLLSSGEYLEYLEFDWQWQLHDICSSQVFGIEAFSKQNPPLPSAFGHPKEGKMQEKEGISLVLRIGVFQHQNISPDRKV